MAEETDYAGRRTGGVFSVRFPDGSRRRMEWGHGGEAAADTSGEILRDHFRSTCGFSSEVSAVMATYMKPSFTARVVSRLPGSWSLSPRLIEEFCEMTVREECSASVDWCLWRASCVERGLLSVAQGDFLLRHDHGGAICR